MLTLPTRLIIRRPSSTATEFTVTTCPPSTFALRLALLGVFFLRVLVAAGSLLLLYTQWIVLETRQGQERGGQATSSGRGGLSSWARRWHPVSLPPQAANFMVRLGDAVREAHQQQQKRQQPSHAAATMTPALVSNGNDDQPCLSILLALPPYLVIALALLLVWAALTLPIHTTERLLVLRGLGIQTSTSTSTGLFPFLSIFEESSSVQQGSSALSSDGGGGNAPLAFPMGRTRFIPTSKIRDVLINEGFWGFEVRYYLVVVVEGESDVVVVFPRLFPGRDVVERVWVGVRTCLYDGEAETGRHHGVSKSLERQPS